MFKQLITFIAGAAIGAVGGYIYAEHKLAIEYEEKTIAEAEALDKLLERRMKKAKAKEDENVVSVVSNSTTKRKEKINEKENDKKEYENTIVKNNYASRKDVTDMTEQHKKPYTIEPSEFGEDDHDTTNWVFWGDGVVSDEETDDIMDDDDIEKYIGHRSLGRFGEYEDDAVYVRNEYLGLDIYVRRDDRQYIDVVGDYRF